MSRIRIGVVGCGHLGAIHARLLSSRSDVELVGVVDPCEGPRGAVAKSLCCEGFASPEDLIGKVDAAVVAAPTGLHAPISIPLLESGVDLLVEKPLASTVEDARAIVIAARRYGRTVAVGHVERFNPAWKLAMDHVGKLVAIQAHRQAPFTFRSMDVGVVLDLMIHDIDLVLSLEPGRLESVEAQGFVATGGHEDLVRARLSFSSGIIADLFASRIHPAVRRSLSLVSTGSIVDVDFNEKTVTTMTPSSCVRDGSFVASDIPVEQRQAMKDSFFSEILPTRTETAVEANAIACEHENFLESIQTGQAPVVPAAGGAAAIEIAGRVLDALAKSQFGASQGPAVVPIASESVVHSFLKHRKTG